MIRRSVAARRRAARRLSQSSFDFRPEDELRPIVSTEGWTNSASGKQAYTVLRKELDHITQLKNNMRSSSCNLIDTWYSRLSSGVDQRGAQPFTLPALTLCPPQSSSYDQPMLVHWHRLIKHPLVCPPFLVPPPHPA